MEQNRNASSTENTITNKQEKQPSLLSSTGKFGIKGLKNFSLTFILFFIINMVIFIWALVRAQFVESTSSHILSLILVFVTSIIFISVAIYLTYKYLVMEGLRVIYAQTVPFFKKLCSYIIDKTGLAATNNLKIKDQQIKKILNTGNLVTEIYGQRVPRHVQKGLNFILKQIPFADMLTEIKGTVIDQDKEKADNMLYNKLDSYISNSLLGNNNMKWLYWMVPLNIIIQCLIVYIFTY